MKYLLIPIIAILYALGGAKDTSLIWRRVGVPICFALAVWNLLGLLLVLPLLLGYGENSRLRKLFKGSNLLTRLVIGGILSCLLCILTWNLIPLLFIFWYVLWTAILKIDDRLIWKLNLEEILVGLGIGLCGIL